MKITVLTPILVYKWLPFASYLGGLDQLNSRIWRHVDLHIGRFHFQGVSNPLPLRESGKTQLCRHQGDSPTPDSEREVGWECPWWRPKRLPWYCPPKRTVCLPLGILLHPPIQPRKNGNHPIMDAAWGGWEHPLRVQGGELCVRQVLGSVHLPQE